MANFYIALLSILVCGIASTSGLGKYDLSLEELGPLCGMVKEFAETGEAPKAKNDYPPIKLPNNECVYYHWTPCTNTKSKNPKRPCGNFELRKCEEKKKRSVLMDHSHHKDKREAFHDDTDDLTDDGPVVLGFPDEIDVD